MTDRVIHHLEMAMEYIQGAIRCRRVNDLEANDVNLTRARTELDCVEAVLEDERSKCGSTEADS